MTSSTSNIEPLARAICERSLRRTGMPENELAADVNRYWHCVAAYIEAGIIDDNGEYISRDVDQSHEAYHDWRARHPDYTPPTQHGISR